MTNDKHIKYDCRFFVGEKPCAHKRVCYKCPKYSPFKERILIIKTGALGDVMRTTPLLHALKRKHPKSQITWLTDPESAPIFLSNTYVDRLLIANCKTLIQLQAEKYDVLINLEKLQWAAALAKLVKSTIKKGYILNDKGALCPVNKDALYAFRLGIDDDLKFRKNKKTYQETIFELCGMKYKGEEYVLKSGKSRPMTAKNMKRPVIGLNTGSGNVFAGKGWTQAGWLALIQYLTTKMKVTCLLLGGPAEEKLNKYLLKRSRSGMVIDTGAHNPLNEFIDIVDLCDVVVAGDTLGMHIGIGLKKKVVAVFGSTCPQEIDLYGRGEKLVAENIPCSPCYKNVCDKGEMCLKKITVNDVVKAIQNLIGGPKRKA